MKYSDANPRQPWSDVNVENKMGSGNLRSRPSFDPEIKLNYFVGEAFHRSEFQRASDSAI